MSLSVVMMASNREALVGAHQRLVAANDPNAATAGFLLMLLDEVLKPQILNRLELNREDRALLGLPASRTAPLDGVEIRPVLRSVWEERLRILDGRSSAVLATWRSSSQ